MPPAVAIAGITAAAGIGTSLLSSGATKSAANSAAAAQTAADQAAIAEQQRQYNQTRADLSPWVQGGTSANQSLMNLLGIGGDATQQQTAINNLKSSPLYQSLFANGENTLLANQSATGGLRGGDTQGALANFGRDTLANVYQNQVGNLSNVSNAGENAAAQTGQFGANSANSIASLLNNQGAAQAKAAYAIGGANAGSANSIGQSLAALANNQNVQSWAAKLF